MLPATAVHCASSTSPFKASSDGIWTRRHIVGDSNATVMHYSAELCNFVDVKRVTFFLHACQFLVKRMRFE